MAWDFKSTNLLRLFPAIIFVFFPIILIFFFVQHFFIVQTGRTRERSFPSDGPDDSELNQSEKHADDSKWILPPGVDPTQAP